MKPRMTLSDIISEIDSDSNLNKARKLFRSLSAELERVGDPIESRRLEFEAVVKIVDAFYGRDKMGLQDLPVIAIRCGNIPYEDCAVCSTCSGKGYVESV